MKPTTIRDAVIDYFHAAIDKQPELKDHPYLCLKNEAGDFFTYQEMTTIYEDHPHFAAELEKGLIMMTIDLLVRGKETLPNNRLQVTAKKPAAPEAHR